MATQHLLPPYLYEHNPNIFVGGDPFSWLNTHVEDGQPPATLAIIVDYWWEVREFYTHCKNRGGFIRPLRTRLIYPNHTEATIFSFVNGDFHSIRGYRFDYAWVSPSIVDDEEAMLYINLAVRKP